MALVITAPIRNYPPTIQRKLRQAAKRYMKCLADLFQLKFREGKTKRKSHRTIYEYHL